jgi:molybdopterin-guanine dinucleotide biosynthesis protein A
LGAGKALEISCIVLAGGRGLRLGRNKALEHVGEQSLLQGVVSSLSPFDSEIVVVTADENHALPVISYPGVRIVTDIFPGRGSLGGVYTGLLSSDSFYNIVVACDMPLLNRSLLEHMVEISAGFDAVVPRLGKFLEPLHAVYSKECIVPIETLFNRGDLSITALFSLINVRYMDADEVERFDPEHLSFFNVNTEDDLNLARELLKGYSASKK